MNKSNTPTALAAVRTQNQAALQQAQMDRLTVQNATLAAENRRLRRLTQNGAAGRLLHRTKADARQIVGWRFAGYSVTRRACHGYGMSERRWAWAVAMLKVARLVEHNAPSIDDFTVEDLDEALAAVDRATALCERDGLHRLVFRLPRGRAKPPKR